MPEPQRYILLIDDDEDDREMFSIGLEMKGLSVKSFASSEKALYFLTLASGNNEMPSLVILDYNMPGKNGHQVLVSLKTNVETKNIPVIMYSTSMSDILREQLSEAGALECFSKPSSQKEFTIQVERFSEVTYSIWHNQFVI